MKKNMKRLAAGLLCAALVWLFFGLISYANPPEEPLKLLVLGDSIAAGSGVNDKNDAYAWLVAEEKGYALSNRGAGGDSSALMRVKVETDEAIREEIAGADIIAVSIGGNDFLHAERFAALFVNGLLGDYSLMEPLHAAFRENFTGIVDGIRALNPDAMLIVQTLYNPFVPLLPSLTEAYNAAVGGNNAAVYAYLADNPGAYLIADVYTAFQGRYFMVSIDMTHPAAGGHAVIARVLLDTIDGTQTLAPVSPGALDVLLGILRPLFTLLDRVLVTALRLLAPLVTLFA
ncbi:MAG: GDSL-type esterase/lipase family protein [Oscillospiraceae bacterium]|nr:GDSL-type esterase/lipase family protein [Oscillospiraceae bacterium]